jgi:two-component system CheB/CheR fusion protein
MNPDRASADGSMSDASNVSGREPNFVVGIGASAGGLEALERMFRNMPTESGMAFVVIQHLSPDFDSMMDELLNRQTQMSVNLVTDGMEVVGDAIYLIPPGKEMIISGGRLLLTDKDPRNGLTLPINQFFRSLAGDLGARSIGVVLSGTGSDGSRGIQDIHDAGGLIIVQTEETAKFDGMPRSALETGVVDLLLSPEDIGPTLQRFVQNPVIGELPSSGDTPPVDEDSMNRLLRMLRNAHGIDFSYYKSGTVRRRIERRLMLNHSNDFEHYVAKVEDSPAELNSLYHDLLIGVTQFFRDPEAFQVLKDEVLPELVSGQSDQEELRIWVAGCATGEEAYSLGIVVDEVLKQMKRNLEVKIFATDVHQTSLEFAGAGSYPQSSLAGVSQERLDRYFLRKHECFQVAPALRKMVVFAQHNIIKDAPFTKLNLITCRNLLIYLQPAVQNKAISLFHFGLRTGGVLFLGPSEGVASLENEFTPVNRHWKMYRKRRDVRFPSGIRLPLTPSVPALRTTRAVPVRGDRGDSELLQLYDQVLEQCVTTAVLIDEVHNVRHVFGDAARYLRLPRGRLSQNLLDMLDPDLRTAVSGAVQRAMKEKSSISYSGIRLEADDGLFELRLKVIPLESPISESRHLLVRFEQEVALPAPTDVEAATVDIGEVSRERTEALELELRRTRESLQATIEELEASNEELHATNEEIVASNEELQSTNEELHSVNEELYSVNAEYQRKIGELTELTDDMQHLLESTDIGTVFLDGGLCIRKVTPRASQTFNILPQDIGRKFDCFSQNIELPSLMTDIQQVLHHNQPVECEVRDRTGTWYFLRILPYRSRGETQGVVLTLIDTQALHSAQRELREKDRQLHSILDNAPAFIYIHDEAGRYLLSNHESQRWVGRSSDELLGRSDREFLPAAITDRIQALEREILSSGESRETELVVPHPQDGNERTWLTAMFPLINDDGRITSVAGIATDITARKQAELQVQQSLRQRDHFLAMLSHELRNPLGALQNGLRLLRHAELRDDIRDRTRAMLEAQTDQMAHLLDDLLDVSRIEHNRVELRRRAVDVRDTARNAVAAIEARFRDADVDLELRLTGETLIVDGDPARLQQVQANLLVNAVKYTPAGGQVSLTVSREADTAVIAVSDNGLGISTELLPRIFEPFVQADDTLDRADGGMGVGLSLAKSLIQLHGGEITAHSDGPGRGSEFIIRLPLHATTTDIPRTPPPMGDPVRRVQLQSSLGELDILLVDDNDEIRDALAMLLELEGYKVRTAADGLTAFVETSRMPPDVAILDLGLPGMDGFQLAERIRQSPDSENVLLIALTGYGQPQDELRSRESGFDLHLTKPVEFERLMSLLNSLCSDADEDPRGSLSPQSNAGHSSQMPEHE